MEERYSNVACTPDAPEMFWSDEQNNSWYKTKHKKI
jgi:hypothetical protein